MHIRLQSIEHEKLIFPLSLSLFFARFWAVTSLALPLGLQREESLVANKIVDDCCIFCTRT